jgi:hypothetical protein
MKINLPFKISKTIAPILIVSFLIIGLIIYKDYGISWDEYQQRAIGLKYTKYIIEYLNLNFFFKDINLEKIISFEEWRDSGAIQVYYGVLFELPLIILEFLFLGTSGNEQQIYQLRHVATFVMYMIGICGFYLQVIKIYKSPFPGVIAIVFLLLSPRIFSEAFYNSKDIIFMSFVSLGMLTLTNLTFKLSIKNILSHSLFVAFAIDIRVMAIFFIPLTFFVIFFNFFIKKINFFEVIKITILFLAANWFFIIIFSPLLWESPIDNFFAVFQNMSQFPADTTMLYMAGTVNESDLPWHYIPVWVLVTTPPLIISLFILGVIFFIVDFFKTKLRNYQEKEILLIANLMVVIGSISTVIFLQSTLYNGWRHLYFVYPSFIIIAVAASFRIFDKIKDFRFGTFIFTLLFLTFSFHQLNLVVKSHPMQNVYFNFVIGNNWKKKFDLDYWGLGSHLAIRDILLNNSDKDITVCQISYMILKNTLRILDTEEKKRIKLMCTYDGKTKFNDSFSKKAPKKFSEPDYLIDNYFRSHVPKNINLNKYKIFRELKVFDETIITVYEKK